MLVTSISSLKFLSNTILPQVGLATKKWRINWVCFGNLRIEIRAKNALTTQSELPKREFSKERIVDYSNGILPIELNPSTEYEFKRRLLLTKTAYITTFYKNGTSKQKVWNANRFRETSGVLGNLRSRPEFRNGEWQKLGIEKVLVSIDK